ncbi:hypothetical protein HN011_006135 [Eciton burchellii]|nr:hypothetical protein HN011_006135 [Eciton burchellii]
MTIAVSFSVERDLRLMTSILGIEHYTLIILGVITVNTDFGNDMIKTEIYQSKSFNLIYRLFLCNYIVNTFWQEYPMLYTPWMLMQLCVIVVEIMIFFAKFFLVGLHIKRNEILQAIFITYNWLQVFCLFHRQAQQTIY